MASIAYNAFLDNLCKGNIDLDTDTFKVMLVTSSYTPSKTHAYRSEIGANEVVGSGYTTGGSATTVSLTKDNVLNREDVTFGNVSWSNATITAKGAVIYKSRGGAASADEMIAFVDFNQDISSTNAAFAVTFTAPLRFQN